MGAPFVRNSNTKGWKGYGKGNGYKGKGKYGGKRSLNMAMETEYSAAWGNGGEGEDWEYQDYSYNNQGYNYTLNQDAQWNGG